MGSLRANQGRPMAPCWHGVDHRPLRWARKMPVSVKNVLDEAVKSMILLTLDPQGHGLAS